MFTPEDELDVLHEELGRARRHLDTLEDPDGIRRQVGRVRALEHELAELIAAQHAADEAYEMDGAASR